MGDYGKCERKCTARFSCSKKQTHFEPFLQKIFIFFHCCIVNFDSFLSYTKENNSNDNVCTFMSSMWQLIGGYKVKVSESWTVIDSDIN